MNVQNKDIVYYQVVDFLSKYLNKPKKNIHLENSLFHDFGVDGDDAVELIQEYASQFNVSLEGFNISEFFGPEISSPIQMIIEIFTKNSFRNTPKLTVEDLINGAIQGRLNKSK
jgi:acyl carrier protein